MSQICRSPLQNHFPFTPEISEEVKRKFDQWWTNQLTPQANPMAHKILPFINPQTAELDFASAAASAIAHNIHPNREQLMENHHPTHPSMIVHPALQGVHTQYPNQKTRMRTSFDPEMELPKLQRWFQENPHPSRQQIQSYVVQLNSLESRRGRKPLDVNNVVYWFKNARAAQKRAETRGHNLTNGYNNQSGLIMPHAEYMKSSPSAPSDDIDNISQHSDDDMDDMDRPMSPQLPLSLTVHERNRPLTPPSIDETKIKQEDENSCPSPAGNNNDKSKSNNNTSNGSNNTEQNENSNFSNRNNNNNNDDSVKSNNSADHNSNSPQPRSPSPSEDLDIEDQDASQLEEYQSPSPDSRRELPFSMVGPNSMFSHSIMYMSHYIPAMQGGSHPVHGQNHAGLNAAGLNLSSSFNSSDERRKRNRTFIDPVTEVPKLEQWFSMNTHPSHNLILKYTEDLNRMPYR